MIGAGLLAKKAVERGLQAKPWVKTSLAPGSKVVTRYLDAAGLTPYLEALGFYTVGYGCTTCIGNSGPLPEEAGAAIRERDLIVAAVISGNRNFEGRVHPQVRANYLASPPLVVAYALAGTVDIDLTTEPLGADRDGNPVYPPRHLAEPGGDPGRHRQQPERRDVSRASTPTSSAATRPGTRSRSPRAICSRGTTRTAPTSTSRRSSSTWPPSRPRRRTSAARGVLAYLGDNITTDHISPAGSIEADSPAGRYLIALACRSASSTSTAPPRQPRGDDARHLRQHPHQEPAGAGGRGRVYGLPGVRSGQGSGVRTASASVHLRRGDEIPGGWHPDHRAGRQGVRHRLQPRLGGQGAVRCWASRP